MSLVLVACSSETVTSTAGSMTRYTATVTVLENRQHGPQMCVATTLSNPPQCVGADVKNWNWKIVESEAAGDTRWGIYRLVGTWDGKRLTLTEPPGTPSSAPPTPPKGLDEKFASPCPEPVGGWKPVNPAKATEGAIRKVIEKAPTVKGFAGAWLDQGYLKGYESGPQSVDGANDPTKLVLNLKFAGKLSGHERWVRKIWGGALCLSGAERTDTELRRIQKDLRDEVEEIQTSDISIVNNRVEAQVFVATNELQQKFDFRYGKGAVILQSLMRSVG
ncbi:hypothetical protein [Streptosporangium sp. NPDC001681]|uniref:hypothetical protein n=1 Tax=Streptosporangium sp. NPDC001681 TaxID=3154395 RepID=UPI00331F2566